jgi:hypothetical protein
MRASTTSSTGSRSLSPWPLRPPAVTPPTELTNTLDEFGASTDWAALITALRQVLAGVRDRTQLLTGLDDIDTAILTTVLDRLPTTPEQHP